MYEPHIARITRAFNTVGVRIVPIEGDQEILLPVEALHRLHERVRQQGNGPAAQRMTHTLGNLAGMRKRGEHVSIRPDEAHKLTRLMDEWEHETTRADKPRRGIIPGALSSREVVDLYRRGLLGR